MAIENDYLTTDEYFKLIGLKPDKIEWSKY